jgi:hypothetical protein
MKNKLGHDDDSELLTIIARIREKKYSIIKYSENEILFQINLIYISTVPISNTTYKNIEFCIETIDKNVFTLKQINGKEKRIIPMAKGYIIWSLLEEEY